MCPCCAYSSFSLLPTGHNKSQYWFKHIVNNVEDIFKDPSLYLCSVVVSASPTLYLSPSLSLSSLLLQRHMALWHATHSIITSHIPWNTSSALSPLVVPRSQSRDPPPLLSLLLSFPQPPAPLPWCLSLGVCGSQCREPQAARASH